MQPWFTPYFFNFEHPCYDQLTSVKRRYALTSVTWLYRRLKFTAHRGHVFFWSWLLTKCWFSIGLRAHVGLTCWKQGRIVRKPVNANPGLKAKRIITFFLLCKCFLLLCFVYIVIIKTHNRRPNNIQKTSTQSYKTTKLKSKFYLSWVSLIWLWTTRPRSYAFRLA